MSTLKINGATYTIRDTVKSREGLHGKIYLTDFYVFKLLDLKRLTHLALVIQNAKEQQIPLARESRVYPAKGIIIKDNNKETIIQDCAVYQAEKHIGQFFQMSRHGQALVNQFVQRYPHHRAAIDRFF